MWVNGTKNSLDAKIALSTVLIPRTSDCPEKYVAYIDLYREGPAEIHCLRGKI